MPINKLILGDNLEILKQLESKTVDLIYLDPPFFSNRNYEVIWGCGRGAQLCRPLEHGSLHRLAERARRTNAPHTKTHGQHLSSLRLANAGRSTTSSLKGFGGRSNMNACTYMYTQMAYPCTTVLRSTLNLTTKKGGTNRSTTLHHMNVTGRQPGR